MFTDVLAYFRTVLDGLGLREWTTAFSNDNIPASILNQSYHLNIDPIVGAGSNHQVHSFDAPVTVRVFLKGYRDESESVDAAIELGQDVMCAVLNSSTRLGANLKDIVPNSMQPIPLSSSNDNSVIIEMSFTAKLYITFN